MGVWRECWDTFTEHRELIFLPLINCVIQEQAICDDVLEATKALFESFINGKATD